MSRESELKHRIGKWLCAIGLHRWRYLGTNLFGHGSDMCVRPYCRVCRQFMGCATVYWHRTERLEGDLP